MYEDVGWIQYIRHTDQIMKQNGHKNEIQQANFNNQILKDAQDFNV